MKYWYAIMDSSIDDHDWGYGSYSSLEALSHCVEMNDTVEKVEGKRPYYIAVIENGCCVFELAEDGSRRWREGGIL